MPRHMASRKHPPHPYHNKLWIAGYAWTSFQNVRNACEYILNNRIQPKDAIYYSLVTAICVLYTRPFKTSKGIERLTVQFVPKKFHHLHDQLILVRDETFAHIDARGAFYQGLHANNVRLIFNKGQVALGVNQMRFNLTAISQIRGLADALVKRMVERINGLGRQYPDDVPDDGEYLIDLTTKTLRRL